MTSSTASNNGVNGFSLGPQSIATDCVAEGNSTGFFLGQASRVRHSSSFSNAVGILGADAVSIEQCTVIGSGDDGIRVGNRGLVRGNLVYTHTNDGIQATGNANRIEENQSHGNSTGIRVDGSNNLIVKNSADANANEYLIAGGNQFGPVSTNPGTAGPWANFDQ